MTALAIIALSGCGALEQPRAEGEEIPREYLGIETRMMDDELVNIRVAMKHARGPEDIDAYTGCAAAQYAAVKGYGFARHVRTILSERGGVYRADAVYTVSAETPRGITIIEAEKALADCAAQSIPAV